MLEINCELVKNKIIDFIRNEVGNRGCVIGLSGGIDSSLTAKLAVEALGKEKVYGLIMPERGITREEDVEDAKEFAEELGIGYEVIEINDIVKKILEKRPKVEVLNEKIAVANIKPRVRMILLYYAANLSNRIVLGTGNKTELLIGYFTKYGDGGVDLLPIGDLYKTQVRMLARHMGIPEKIINKTPTAGLWKGQTDEGEIGIKYELLDKILFMLVDRGYSIENIANNLKIGLTIVKKVKDMVDRSEHKRTMPKICKISGIS